MTTKHDLELADDISRFYDDPLGFVLYAWDWDNDPSLRLVELQEPWSLVYDSKYGPDAWFCELCDRVQSQVRANAFDGVQPVKAVREAIASGHGIGKSAGVAWIVNWIMSTRPFAKGTVTATTAPQLETKTWAEVARWNKRCITGHWFEVTTGRGSMKMRHVEHPESWYCTAQTCQEENSEAFAGQHAANSTSFYIFDEASGVPDKIAEVAEGGLTDGEPMVFAFGNPTQNTGWFYECFHSMRHRWNHQQIDSRNVQITNKVAIEEWRQDHGENSDFFKVRVRGMFPSMSAKQFIAVADADAALGRHLRREQYGFAPKILTLDPAWDGDDELVIGLRQGLHFRVLRTIPKNDNDIEIATLLAVLEDEHEADAVFIDKGYGTGIYSAGQTWGRDWLLVDFGSKSPDPGCLNMRAYIWREMRDWIKKGGAIPDDPQMHSELISIQTVPRMEGLVQLESKKEMKKRVGFSPNRADALAISFAFPVTAKIRMPRHQREHDPYDLAGALDHRHYEHDPYSNLG